MKTLSLFIALITLVSCSAPWHLQKAIDKQPDIINVVPDTVTKYIKSVDTTYTDTGTVIRETIIEVKEVVNTVYIQPKSRYDYKAERDSLKHALAMEREKTKQAKAKGKEDVKKERIRARELIKKAKEYEHTKRVKERQENKRYGWIWWIVIFVLIISFLLYLFRKLLL
jgi:hypothetical protein